MAQVFSLPRLSAADFGDALINPDLGTPEGAVGPDGFPDVQRFNVYRNNVIVSLCEALGETYPSVKALLGEEYFAALARAFIAEHRPSNPVLIWYGEEFASFLAAFPPLKAYPYLEDVARLEWAWLQSYHAKDCEVFDPAALASIQPADLGGVRFRRHPATAIVASEWPIWDLVRVNRFKDGEQSQIDLSVAQPVLIVRPEFDVDVRILEPSHVAFGVAIFSGASLGEAAETALDVDSGFTLADCLSNFLSNGALAGLQIKEPA